ncbi:ABC transporter substrate-binding protein [Paenibacillus selenitireducens]|uniref:ABC transporter substrate-binding protein n=1 Tax=Paenibacillus selenitireducens TaxID=1324314 RepID=A0A1T2XHG5_9BACL|nr:ABC transporter substrate-binding protein [Paenibacillus selenitireducens]OPA79329.1 ABC transporter substrate-binding protein [Paenibacillus selenitireducens]
MFHTKANNVRKYAIILSCLLALTVFLSACSNSVDRGSDASSTESSQQETTKDPAADEAKPKTVTDVMGHEVTIPAHPERIIASYLEDPLVTLGMKPAAQWSVANGIQDYLQTDLKGIPTIAYDLPTEAVLSFNPDLLIVSSENTVGNGMYEQLSKIAPTYVLGDKISKDWRQALLKIGELLNKSPEAEQALKEYDAKAKDTKEKLTKAVGQKSAAILWLTNKQFFLVDETVSSAAVLYNDLGMLPPNLVSDIPDDKKASWNSVSLEKLAGLDADYIFLVNSDKMAGTDETLGSPIWKGLKAVKEGHVIELPSTSSWLYSGVKAGEQIMDDVLKNLVK